MFLFMAAYLIDYPRCNTYYEIAKNSSVILHSLLLIL